jgi:tetratricopeptide (TPR) repeat protein
MLAYEARDLTDLGRAPEAVRLLEQSKSAWQKLPGPYTRWGVFAVALSNAYVAVGRYKDAEGLISTLVSTLTKAYEKQLASWSLGYPEYIWADSLVGQHRYAEALTHAENASKDWSTIPTSTTISPEGSLRIANLNRLLVQIQARLNFPQYPSNASHPSANPKSN